VKLSDNRVLVTAERDAATVQRAFNTSIVQFRANGKTYFVNATDVQVPDCCKARARGDRVANTVEMKPLQQAAIHNPRSRSPPQGRSDDDDLRLPPAAWTSRTTRHDAGRLIHHGRCFDLRRRTDASHPRLARWSANPDFRSCRSKCA